MLTVDPEISPVSVLTMSYNALMLPRNSGSEEEVRGVIDTYFLLFSRRDAKGLLDVVNFPHVRVTASGTVIIPSAEEWMGDPTPLEPDYHHTELDSLTFVQSDAL